MSIKIDLESLQELLSIRSLESMLESSEKVVREHIPILQSEVSKVKRDIHESMINNKLDKTEKVILYSQLEYILKCEVYSKEVVKLFGKFLKRKLSTEECLVKIDLLGLLNIDSTLTTLTTVTNDGNNSIKDYLNSRLSSIETIVNDIDLKYDEAREKHSYFDKLKLDIEHEMELDVLSASERACKYKEYHSCLKLRRKYKEGVEYFLKAKSCLNIAGIESAKIGIDQIEFTNSKKSYTHRVNKEMRQELLDEINRI